MTVANPCQASGCWPSSRLCRQHSPTLPSSPARGKDLKAQHEQKVCERELQRITLPLSAFTNPTCEIVDEKTIVVHASQTPVDLQEGSAPLMGQAGTPGA